MVSRTLLALVLIAAMIVERRVPNSREPGREIARRALCGRRVAYMTSAAYFGLPSEPGMHPRALLSRPGDLLPRDSLCRCRDRIWPEIAASCLSLRPRFGIALWMNVACHVLATQSERLLDAPFTWPNS